MANGNGNGTDKEGMGYRNVLALIILIFSIAGVLTIGITVVIQKPDNATVVMTAVLPLLGTWVGTILAYYFSKENFEAATRSVTELAKQITPQEKLRSTPAKEKMIPKDKMYFEQVTAGTTPANIKLMDVLNRLVAANKGRRIPFLNEQDHPLYVIHRSMVDKFLADNALSASPADPKTLTLQNLLDSPELKSRVDKSFAVIKEAATLADAKTAMDAIPDCQDVFVTKTGNTNEPILGWITNVIIEDNSRA